MRILFAALAFLALALPASADPFRLGSDDKVDVRVFGRPDLSQSLKVDGDGNLRLPLIGSVPAAGATIDEVEARLVIACRDIAGILGPRVTVTVLETGPVFVGGAVQNPGRYPWASDLTPAKAYALTGGAPRLLENGGPLLAFESYRAVEQEEQAYTRLAAAVLRRSRLAAEAVSADTFTPPKNWADGLTTAQSDELLSRERHLFAKRREALAGEANNLKRQSQILVEQEAAYKASLVKKAQQKVLLQQELAAMDGEATAARLVPVTRLLSLKRSIIEVENDQRDIERRITETKLQSTITEQTTANLLNARVIEASSQLAEVERELVGLRDSLEPTRRRADVGRLVIGNGRASARPDRDGRTREPSFSIRREVNGHTEVIEAGPDTRLLPRDLVQVTAPPSSGRSDGPGSDRVSERDSAPGPQFTEVPVRPEPPKSEASKAAAARTEQSKSEPAKADPPVKTAAPARTGKPAGRDAAATGTIPLVRR